MLLLCRDQVLEMFDHAYGSYMVAAALPAFTFQCCTILKPQTLIHPSVRPFMPSIISLKSFLKDTRSEQRLFSPSLKILLFLQKYAYPADELMPLSCRGRVRGQEPNRGDIDESLGK